jgi:hypothetical protein
MTKDDIVKMAQEAGIGGMLTDVVCTIEELERFAALVAAAERAAEREACAQIAFNANTYIEAAAAIRARGQHD